MLFNQTGLANTFRFQKRNFYAHLGNWVNRKYRLQISNVNLYKVHFIFVSKKWSVKREYTNITIKYLMSI